MKRAREPVGGAPGRAAFWLLLSAAALGAFGAAMEFAAPRAAAALWEQPGAASALGLGVALAAALVARIMRLALGRREREGEGDVRDRA